MRVKTVSALRNGLGLFAGSALFLYTAFCAAYIMPCEQILGFMAENFSKIHTCIIEQSTTVFGGDDQLERRYVEKVWLKSPDLFHAEPMKAGIARSRFPDATYRQFMLAGSPESLLELLGRLGIDTECVALDRTEENVVYRIGKKTGPHLMVDKDRFLPLLLRYLPPGSGPTEPITVEFRDYGPADEGWLPHEISYIEGDGYTERYSIERFQLNQPIDDSIFVPISRPLVPEPPPGSDPDIPASRPRLQTGASGR